MIVDLIDEVLLQKIDDEQTIISVRNKVNEMMEGHPLFS